MTSHPQEELVPDSTFSVEAFRAKIDAAVLRNITMTLSIASIGGMLMFLYLALLPNQTPELRHTRTVSGLMVLGASLVSLLIYKQWGQKAAAAFFATAGFAVSILSAMRVGSGVASTGAMIPAAWIVTMSFAIGPRAGRVATHISMLAVAGLVLMQWLGVIPGINPSNTQPALSYGIVLVLIFSLIGATISQYSRMFWDAIRAIDRTRKELQQKVEMQERTQRELMDSKQRLATLLDHAPMAILIFDKDTGRLHYANQNAFKAHGAQRLTELPRLCVLDEPPFHSRDLLRHLHATRDHGVQQVRWCSRTVQGERIWWDVKFDTLQIDDELFVVSFGHDITRRLEAEQALEDHRAHLEEQVRERTAEVVAQTHRLSTIIEALPVSLNIKDQQGRFQLSNRLFEEACGHSKTQLQGRTPDELFPPEMAEQCGMHHDDLLQGEEMVRFEATCPRPDGTHKDQLVTKVPLRNIDGKPEAVLTLAVDISEQKAMQRELAAAKIEAERLASVKSAFLANMSHEIRTPLHGMLGLAQIGAKVSAKDPQAAQAFANISRSGRHLLGVINDILDFSKIDAGKMTVEHTVLDPQRVAEDAVAMVASRARDKNLEIGVQCETAIPAAIMGDPQRIRQILLNLLSNAVRFTEHGRITVSLAVDGNRLHLAVQDTGIGMHPDVQARVFSPFEQADGTVSRRYGGTGLGLSISQQLARLMGGDITLQSALKQGSTFTLALPLIEADARLLPADQGVVRHSGDTLCGPRLHGLRILAADDVEINREILLGLLEQEGADVTCCDNGKLVIEAMRARPAGYFDVVLMDVQMPVMNGLQATQLIHMIEPDLPVIALTAHALAEEGKRCLDAGMVAHLAKPFDSEDVIALALRHTRRSPVPATEPPQANSTPPSGAEAARSNALPAEPPNPGPATPGDASSSDITLELDAALRRCGGKQALLHKLLTRFADEQADFVARCQKLLGEDPDQARRAAHTLKGTAGNLGLPGLSKAAGELEHALTAQDMAGIARNLHAVAESMKAHLPHVREWLLQPATA